MSKDLNLPKFPVVKPSLHTELKNQVNLYFKNNNIEQHGNFTLYSKAIILVVSFFALYAIIMFAPIPIWATLIACALLGLNVALIGFNIMHDGNHGSFSANPRVNKWASYCGSLMGASQFMWSIKHNIIHHTFTNVDGVDDDIEAGDMLRLAPTQEYRKIHRFQHIYFVLLYAAMYIFWIFFSDYRKYFSKKIGEYPLKKMDFELHLRFWGVKVLHLILFVIVPIYIHGFLPWLVGFLVMSLIGGFFLSIVFQLAHTVEHTSFPLPDADTNKLESEFAKHQLQTTANFATNNKFWTWMLGGLNFQVEHHLFPKISHVHYPAISKIIKNVCVNHDIDYIEYPNMRTAIQAHVAFLKRMGKEDNVVIA